MKKKGYRYHSTLEIRFEDEDKADWMYKSIYSDIVKTVSKDFKVDLKFEDTTLIFDIYSNSLSKFRGIYKTILRLLHMLDKLENLFIEE